MHFDPVESGDPSVPAFAGRERAEDDDGRGDAGPTPREGLPARFRMRHGRHYVDELLGEAPLRTVREIPVADIEPPEDDDVALDGLEASIRQLGVLEPLLVARVGLRYRVIAGMRRLSAAHRVGLGTVPCLVHDVDEGKVVRLREATAARLVEPTPSPAHASPPPASVAPIAPAGPESTGREATRALDFMAALLPALAAAGRDPLRSGVLTDLVAVEVARARMLATAREILARTAAIECAPASVVSVTSDVLSALATEARLRGVRLDVTAPVVDCDVELDAALCRQALTCVMHGLLALAPRLGTVLAIHTQVTSVRPALIVQAALLEGEVSLSADALPRFFDGEWQDHPCGPSGALLFGAAWRVARLHGGRVDVHTRANNGCAVTFVTPKPL